MLEDFRLRVFKTVAEKGSFTLAARELGVSQPAVSQHIAELEKALGADLFTRTPGKVVLTSAGAVFDEHASAILRGYSALASLFTYGERRRLQQRVIVSADAFVQTSLLPRMLASVLSVAPNLSLTVQDPCTVRDQGQEADLSLWSAPHEKEPTLDSGRTVVQTVQAAAVAGDGRYSKAKSLSLLPPSTRLAIWKPYAQLLSVPRTMLALEADSPQTIVSLVHESPDLVGIVPLPAVPIGTESPRIPLPELQADIHLQPSDSFADDPLCDLFRSFFERT